MVDLLNIGISGWKRREMILLIEYGLTIKTIYKYLISELDKLNTNCLLKPSISSLDTFYTNKNRRFRVVC